MTHLLIDALSVNNPSGRHVLAGHVRELALALAGHWRFTLLTHRGNADFAAQCPASVAHAIAPVGSNWRSRGWWCLRRLEALIRERDIDLLLSPSGMLTPGCPVPQIVLAQNPLPLVSMPSMSMDGLRLSLQRKAFASAQRRAWRMVFNSRYMQGLYEATFGPPARPAVIAHQGIDDVLLERDAPDAGSARARERTVLCASVMARHKAIEVLVQAFERARFRGPDVRLVLVGGWPDAGYRAEIEGLVDRLGLRARVEFAGHVSSAALRAHYACARVFCLLSRCESFGIPAIEAQAAGTPTVVSEGTAAPEIAGPGGFVVGADDADAAAVALAQLVDDDALWSEHSQRARRNAERFRWRECSRPLVEAIAAFEPVREAA